jgi:hypothetical protein
MARRQVLEAVAKESRVAAEGDPGWIGASAARDATHHPRLVRKQPGRSANCAERQDTHRLRQ